MPVRPGRNGAAQVVSLDVLNRYAKDPKDFEKAIERFNAAKAEAAAAHAKTVAANRELDQRIRDFEANKRRQAEWLEEEQKKLSRTAARHEKLTTGLANRIQRSRGEKIILAGVEETLAAREEAVAIAAKANKDENQALEAREERIRTVEQGLASVRAELENEKTDHRKQVAALRKNLSGVMADGDN